MVREIKKQIQSRIAQIRKEIDKTDSEFDREKLQERLAKLTGGVAVINVGAATEVENEREKRAGNRCGGSNQSRY